MKFREGAEQRWNPHMGGASQPMECLVDSEEAQSCPHQFALTNAVKCVAATGSQRSESTPVMKGNCAEHLRSEIDCLRPHLVMTQGNPPKITLFKMFHPLRHLAEFSGPAGTAQIATAHQFVILTTPHPARKSGWRWKRGPLPEFLQQAVKRAAEEVLTFMYGEGTSALK
jgi:uracil-DNA glycosylase